MELNTTIEGSDATIAIDGKLTVATASSLESALKDLPAGTVNVSLDMTKMEYIASAGLRVIVSASKFVAKSGGTLRLLHPNEEVMEVFDATGLIDILAIEQ